MSASLPHTPAFAPRLALVMVWSRVSPDRVGEVLLLPEGPRPVLFGRATHGSEGESVLTPVQQRPGHSRPTGPLTDARLSRNQARFVRGADPSQVDVQRIGRCPMAINGERIQQGTLSAGDTLTLHGSTVLYLTHRPQPMPPATHLDERGHPLFGDADAFGLVGESPCIWGLRDQLASVAREAGDVLLYGPSGTGRELAARTVHGLSDLRTRAWVACHGDTLPEGVVEGARGSTLFLDAIDGLPDAAWDRLNVAPGADVRIVAAAHSAPAALAPERLTRFPLQVELPGLNERREDVPLIARHLLCQAAARDPELAARFVPDGRPRLDPKLVAALVRHRYTHHVRELDTLLWQAIGESLGDTIEYTRALRSILDAAQSGEATGPIGATPGSTPPASLSPDAISAALQRNDGVIETTWRELGLKNRFQLMRLIKKHGLRDPRS